MLTLEQNDAMMKMPETKVCRISEVSRHKQAFFSQEDFAAAPAITDLSVPDLESGTIRFASVKGSVWNHVR